MAGKIAGIFAPIPTPFINEEIAFDKLRENLAWWGATELAGVVVMGSNGEFVYLSEREKEELIAVVRENLNPGKKVIAGTGCESTKETVRLTKRAGQLGADAALIVTPHYYKGSMTNEALKKYYFDVADASPIPVMLYNMPNNTGLNMPAKLVSEVSTHPNIVGIKDSSGNIVQISEIIANVRPDFSVFAGSASFLLTSLAMGAVGGTLATANIVPNQCVAIQRLFAEGRLDEARQLQLKILPVNAAVTSRWGVAGLKAAMDLLGHFGGAPRRPTLPLKEAEREELRRILAEFGALA
ncbi:MAG: dihydrodipicolinate synthase family protein [Firmicutes bacterium]|nr:dihydrodipicolinate synthase family protein [Bacillota bacterium]